MVDPGLVEIEIFSAGPWGDAEWTVADLDEMVANFGPHVLSTPSKHGFDALAWILPIGGVLIGIAALGYGARHWTRRAALEPAQPAVMDPDLERRVDEELARFDG